MGAWPPGLLIDPARMVSPYRCGVPELGAPHCKLVPGLWTGALDTAGWGTHGAWGDHGGTCGCQGSPPDEAYTPWCRELVSPRVGDSRSAVSPGHRCSPEEHVPWQRVHPTPKGCVLQPCVSLEGHVPWKHVSPACVSPPQGKVSSEGWIPQLCVPKGHVPKCVPKRAVSPHCTQPWS